MPGRHVAKALKSVLTCMQEFNVYVSRKGKADDYFTSEMEASDLAHAVELSSRSVVQAWLSVPPVVNGKPDSVTVVISNGTAPLTAYTLDLKVPCAIPCAECGGYGGVDTGGMTPQGEPIWTTCQSCHPPTEVPADYSEILAETPATTRAVKRLEDIHAQIQDNVWNSMGKYSSKLGWGLSGHQPECWACLDSAVDELVKARGIIKELRSVLELTDRNSDTMVVDAVKLLKSKFDSNNSHDL